MGCSDLRPQSGIPAQVVTIPELELADAGIRKEHLREKEGNLAECVAIHNNATL